ncbi:hypothetical protein IMG5_014640 [Ichthyophthirius multifiliis]|uniref:Alkyl transferase n=1 Tax=Ichthyophthirius multifiliis TaxID=5932 RepID=G0QK91_ICHMU|nr:hypothetical protein IMG5_014640 [Ichthyophthirius multifiliis]EGR34367.1 hypothetical protein IMG5_014640 [Ichthyophthirius multifiliis]|eukprot:XP_004039671.1 hypothetical protein IMG5_014640 [Ichthyophthirius multifiliis]
MDGNRRFASKKNLPKTQGHYSGLNSLKQCLEWCLNLGVNQVSVFAFAIENFKRSQEEIEVLMNLAKKNLLEMAQKDEFLQQNNIKVNICGNIKLCKEDVQEAMKKIEELTKQNTKLQLDICFAYNSTFEIDNSIQNIIKQEDISIENFKKNLLIQNNPDIIVRTSNEIRLSNFMIFQSNNSQLMFMKENWPEISIFTLAKIILKYQNCEKRQEQIQQMLNFQ